MLCETSVGGAPRPHYIMTSLHRAFFPPSHQQASVCRVLDDLGINLQTVGSDEAERVVLVYVPF